MKVKSFRAGFQGSCVFALILSGCGPEPTSETGNPLLAPEFESDSALDGASYALRRGPLERHVSEHHAELLAEIGGAEGSQLGRAMTLADVPETERGVVAARLASDLELYRGSQEALVRALLVHGG